MQARAVLVDNLNEKHRLRPESPHTRPLLLRPLRIQPSRDTGSRQPRRVQTSGRPTRCHLDTPIMPMKVVPAPLTIDSVQDDTNNQTTMDLDDADSIIDDIDFIR